MEEKMICNVIRALTAAIAAGVNTKQSCSIKSGEQGSFILQKGGYRHALNQFLRRCKPPKERYLVSKAANELWNKLGNGDDIRDYAEAMTVRCCGDVHAEMFQGAQKTGTVMLLHEGTVFPFNRVFHEEHVVAVNDVMAELVRLYRDDRLSDAVILETVGKMYICIMLKGEDRRIARRTDRGTVDYKRVISGLYRDAGIECLFV